MIDTIDARRAVAYAVVYEAVGPLRDPDVAFVRPMLAGAAAALETDGYPEALRFIGNELESRGLSTALAPEFADRCLNLVFGTRDLAAQLLGRETADVRTLRSHARNSFRAAKAPLN